MKRAIRLGKSVLRRIIDESVIRVLNESELTPFEYGQRKTFIKRLNMGLYDNRLYGNKEAVKKSASSFIDERLLDKVFKLIDERYNMLHKKYPDGMPVLSDEEIELRKRGRRTIRNIERGRFDYEIYRGGEKYIDKIRRRYPNFPQVAEVAEKRLEWLLKVYKGGRDVPHDYCLDGI